MVCGGGWRLVCAVDRRTDGRSVGRSVVRSVGRSFGRSVGGRAVIVWKEKTEEKVQNLQCTVLATV